MPDSLAIELNQQVRLISDDLQQKLQQQSFWVKSNNPIGGIGWCHFQNWLSLRFIQ